MTGFSVSVDESLEDRIPSSSLRKRPVARQTDDSTNTANMTYKIVLKTTRNITRKNPSTKSACCECLTERYITSIVLVCIRIRQMKELERLTKL